MKIRRFIAVFLSALILCGVLTVPAAALEDPAIRAKAALLVEAETGTILYDKNIHDELSIASTTKIMSALLVFEAIDRGELRLDQQVTATATALRGLPEDGSTADIVEGETLTVEQLLYCMLVISANETCNILGETLCGSVDAFVERMNQRAQELGCKNTHFANTTGLTQSGHYSSAYDLYLITREAMKHEDFMTMVNTKSYEIPPTNKTEEERVLHSTNALISNWRLAGYLYSGAQGIKTGSTDAAGQCLVSSAVRGSRTLISVVLGAEKVEKENGSGYIVESFTETARLFDWGFDNFAPQQVLDENELIQEVPVALSKQVSTVAVHPAESADAMLPKDLDVSALTRTVTLDNETALAPIAAGDRLGEITVSYGDTTYVTVPLLAVADVSASRFLSLRHAIGEFFSQRSARIAVLALVVLVAALVLWFRFYGRNRPSGACMPGLLREHYRALGQNDYIATVHRLDRLVGGVMLFSRRRDVTGKLTAVVAEHRVTKEYLAVLRGTPAQDEATLTDLLFRDAAHNKSYVVKRMRKGVRQASLSYTVQGEADGLTLVRVQLHTGRTHQIRVQFSSRGLPLLGDIRYGSKADCSPALWSTRLALTHPVTGKPIDIACPPPDAWPWNLFA